MSLRCLIVLLFSLLTLLTPLDAQQPRATSPLKRDKDVEAFKRLVGQISGSSGEEKLKATEEALEQERRLNVWPEGFQPRRAVRTALLATLGAMYFDRQHGDRADNLEKALTAYVAAFALLDRNAQPVEWAVSAYTLADVHFYRLKGDRSTNLGNAIKHYEEALPILERHNPTVWATALHRLGVCYRDRTTSTRANNIEKAVSALRSSLSVRKREALPDEWAATSFDLALAYAQQNRFEQAIELVQGILSVWSRSADPENWAKAQIALGGFYVQSLATGDVRLANLRKAAAAYDLALNIFNPNVAPDVTLPLARQLGEALIELGHWDRATRALTAARQSYLRLYDWGLHEDESRRINEDAGLLFSLLAFAEAKQGRYESALRFLNEGKARALGLTLGVRHKDFILSALIESYHFSVRAYKDNIQPPGQEKLAKQRQDLVARLRAFEEKEEATRQKDWTELVPSGGAILAPIVTHAGTIMLAATNSPNGLSIASMEIPSFTRRRLSELAYGTGADRRMGGWFGAYRIQYLPDAEYEKRANEWLAEIEGMGPGLWELFGAKAAELLSRQGVPRGATIAFLPSGPLAVLPIGLATDPKTRERLGETYTLVSVPNLEAIAAAKATIAATSSKSLLAVVNPAGEIAELNLPYAEIEGAIIASMFPSNRRKVLNKTNASNISFSFAGPDTNYWHFSSHGVFNFAKVRYSGLIMRNRELLTVGTVMLTRDGQRLVVLSACETGLVDIYTKADDVVGLPAIFMQRGAAGVLSSLWQVDDLATAFLMVKFYDRHLNGGIDPPRALKEAQKWLQTATAAELIAYIRQLGESANLASAGIDDVIAELGARGRSDGTRFGTLRKGIRGNLAGKEGATVLRETPFAHPYYWGGFFYTGL